MITQERYPKNFQEFLDQLKAEDEFAFRSNRELSTYRGKLFYRLIQQSVATEPKPLNELIKKT